MVRQPKTAVFFLQKSPKPARRQGVNQIGDEFRNQGSKALFHTKHAVKKLDFCLKTKLISCLKQYFDRHCTNFVETNLNVVVMPLNVYKGVLDC